MSFAHFFPSVAYLLKITFANVLYSKKERGFQWMENFFVVVGPENSSPRTSRKMLLPFKNYWVYPRIEREAVVCR